MPKVLLRNTKHKHLTEALEKSEARLRALTDNLPNVAVYQYVLTAGGEIRFNYLSEGIHRILGVPRAEAILSAEALCENIHPGDMARFRAAEEESARALTVFQIEARIRTRSDEIKWMHWRSAPLRLENGDTVWDGVVADITERKRAEEALRRANRAVLMLKKCNEALVRANGESELLYQVCQIVVTVWGAKMAWVGFPEDNPNKTVRPVARAGDIAPCLKNGPVTWARNAKGQGPTGRAIRTGKMHICRSLPETRSKPGEQEKREGRAAAAIALPISEKDRCVGALTIYSKEADAFNDEEVVLLKQLANDLSYGISARRTHEERVRLQAELLKISEWEKQHIAQELHDGLCQHLAGAALMANLLARRLAGKGEQETDDANYICDLLNTGMEETRNLAHGLFPVKEGGEGLTEALSKLAATVTKLFHIRCSFDCVQPVIIDTQTTATHLFRIAQEAINNGIKHGQARRVSITLGKSKREIKLVIRDNGSGIPENLPGGGGMGLQIMRHRAATIGAKIAIGRAGRNGTRVVCTLKSPRPETANPSAGDPEINFSRISLDRPSPNRGKKNEPTLPGRTGGTTRQPGLSARGVPEDHARWSLRAS